MFAIVDKSSFTLRSYLAFLFCWFLNNAIIYVPDLYNYFFAERLKLIYGFWNYFVFQNDIANIFISFFITLLFFFHLEKYKNRLFHVIIYTLFFLASCTIQDLLWELDTFTFLFTIPFLFPFIDYENLTIMDYILMFMPNFISIIYIALFFISNIIDPKPLRNKQQVGMEGVGSQVGQ